MVGWSNVPCHMVDALLSGASRGRREEEDARFERAGAAAVAKVRAAAVAVEGFARVAARVRAVLSMRVVDMVAGAEYE